MKKLKKKNRKNSNKFEVAVVSKKKDGSWQISDSKRTVNLGKPPEPCKPFLSGCQPKSIILLKDTVKTLEERCQQYGGSDESFKRIATGWTQILGRKLKPAEPVTARDVARMMIWLKISRDIQTPKQDNMVDICGYASLTEDIT